MKFALPTMAALLLACGSVLAQRPDAGSDRATDPNRASQQDRRATHANHEHSKHESAQDQTTKYFAAKLMLMNESTIHMSETAQQRANSQEVKQFARQLVDAHRQLNEKLRECAPELAQQMNIGQAAASRTAGYRGTETVVDRTTDAQNAGDERDRRDAQRSQDAASLSQGRQRGDASASDWTQHSPIREILKIEQQATRNYLNSTSQMLERYQGQDFDMGFLGFQIGSHTWAHAELKAIESANLASDEKFSRLVADAASKIEQHLQRAKKLSRQLEDDENLRSSGRRTVDSQR